MAKPSALLSDGTYFRPLPVPILWSRITRRSRRSRRAAVFRWCWSAMASPCRLPRCRDFPVHRLVPPAFDEVRTLETVNAAIAKLGFPRLDRLPQLFSGDACLVQSFPLLDPYDTQRVSPVEGPVFEQPPIPRAADAKQVFAYLSTDSNGWMFLLEALIPVAKCLRIHALSWPKTLLSRLAAAGARVHITLQPIAGILAGSRLVVHLG